MQDWLNIRPLDPRNLKTLICDALGVGEEGLADVAEGDRLGVGEVVDGRIAPLPLTAPAAEEEAQWLDVGVQCGRHRR